MPALRRAEEDVQLFLANVHLRYELPFSTGKIHYKSLAIQ